MGIHGGNIYDFGDRKNELIDYSSNINPLGISKKLEKKLIESFKAIEKYPDVQYRELREKIAEFNGLTKENILVGNGAVELLFLYIKALNPKKALIVAPTFAEYERALLNIKCEIEFFQLKEENDFKIEFQDLKEKINGHELVILCNPNNPTGKFIDLEDIEKISKFLVEKNSKLFIDECFIEFINGWEKITGANLKDPNIFILRAFTKFFAIPGLRLGYGVVFNEQLFKKIESSREPWSINSFAEIAGKTLLDDIEYIEKTYEWIDREKIWFYEQLSKFQDIKPYATETNFILLKLRNMKAEEFKEKMLEKNYLVRDASNFKFLNSEYVRLAIKDRENNEKILNVMRKIIN